MTDRRLATGSLIVALLLSGPAWLQAMHDPLALEHAAMRFLVALVACAIGTAIFLTVTDGYVRANSVADPGTVPDEGDPEGLTERRATG